MIHPEHPGAYLRDELKARGWTQQKLANILGVSVVSVNQIVMEKANIGYRQAVRLAAAFDTSVDLWLNLDRAYRLPRIDIDVDAIRRRAQAAEQEAERDAR